MNVRDNKRVVLCIALTAALGACVTVPRGPPAEVARLQTELDQLHADARIASNGGEELRAADAAVYALARDARHLNQETLQQEIYVADRLVEIAEASGLARFAEQRGMQLGTERERLLAQADARTSRVVATTTTTRVLPAPVRTDSGELMPRSRAELMAMQQQLPGMESRVDARGLVVRFGDYLFEPDRATLTPKAEQSLDALARVLRNDSDASVTIEGYGNAGEGGIALQRAQAVRDYLDARGVDLARIDARSVAPYAGSGRRVAMQDRHVDIVIRTELD